MTQNFVLLLVVAVVAACGTESTHGSGAAASDRDDAGLLGPDAAVLLRDSKIGIEVLGAQH